jgi:hypothetical protein
VDKTPKRLGGAYHAEIIPRLKRFLWHGRSTKQGELKIRYQFVLKVINGFEIARLVTDASKLGKNPSAKIKTQNPAGLSQKFHGLRHGMAQGRFTPVFGHQPGYFACKFGDGIRLGMGSPGFLSTFRQCPRDPIADCIVNRKRVGGQRPAVTLSVFSET